MIHIDPFKQFEQPLAWIKQAGDNQAMTIQGWNVPNEEQAHALYAALLLTLDADPSVASISLSQARGEPSRIELADFVTACADLAKSITLHAASKRVAQLVARAEALKSKLYVGSSGFEVKVIWRTPDGKLRAVSNEVERTLFESRWANPIKSGPLTVIQRAEARTAAERSRVMEMLKQVFGDEEKLEAEEIKKRIHGTLRQPEPKVLFDSWLELGRIQPTTGNLFQIAETKTT